MCDVIADLHEALEAARACRVNLEEDHPGAAEECARHVETVLTRILHA